MKPNVFPDVAVPSNSNIAAAPIAPPGSLPNQAPAHWDTAEQYDQSTMIGIPCRANPAVHMCNSLIVSLRGIQLQRKQAPPIIWDGAGSIVQSRNNLAWKFLQDPSLEQILFLDDDMVFSYFDFLKLYDHPGDIVTTTYAKRIFPPQMVGVGYIRPAPDRAGISVDDKGKTTITKGGFVSQLAPGGFLKIRRRALVKITEVFPDRFFYVGKDDEQRYKFFNFDTYLSSASGRPHQFGEDYSFSYLAERAGLVIDFFDSTLGHVGPYTFTCDTKAIQRGEIPPTPEAATIT